VDRERARDEYDYRETNRADDVLFWAFETTTFLMACQWERQHRIADEDQRIGLFAHQEQLLTTLDPTWARRWRAELTARVPDTAALMPPGPEL
jgi:Immunity protein 63